MRCGSRCGPGRIRIRPCAAHEASRWKGHPAAAGAARSGDAGERLGDERGGIRVEHRHLRPRLRRPSPGYPLKGFAAESEPSDVRGDPPMRPGAGATHAGPLILVMRFRFRSSSKRAPGSMLRACCQTDGEGMATLLTDVSTTRVRSTGRSASMTTGAWPSARGLSGRRQWASTLKRVSDSSTGSTPGAPRLRAARISRAARSSSPARHSRRAGAGPRASSASMA